MQESSIWPTDGWSWTEVFTTVNCVNQPLWPCCFASARSSIHNQQAAILRAQSTPNSCWQQSYRPHQTCTPFTILTNNDCYDCNQNRNVSARDSDPVALGVWFAKQGQSAGASTHTSRYLHSHCILQSPPPPFDGCVTVRRNTSCGFARCLPRMSLPHLPLLQGP